jgi:signal transduction histidine kinase
MSLQWRLTLALTGIFLLSLVPLGLFTVREAQRTALDTLRTSALSRLGFYREVTPGALEPLSALAQEFGGYGFVEGPGGRRYTDTGAHTLPKPVARALRERATYSGLHGDALFVTIPLEVGAAGLAVRVESVSRLTSRLVGAYTLTSAALLVLVALTGRWVLRTLLAPLTALSREIRARSADNLTPFALPAPAEVRPTVTHLNRLLDDFRRALERSRQQEAAAKRFSAQASHELRTPLAALSTYLEVLRRHPENPQAQAGVTRVLARTRSLLDALLTLARLEGRAEVRTEVVAVRAFAAERFPQLAVAGDAHLLAEPDLLELALGNLLSNAERYGRPPLRLCVERQGARVWLFFEDAGDGFPDPLLKRAFEPFIHGDNRGTGLGLAIVRAVVAAHGGEVRLENAPAGGARVGMSYSSASA